VMADEKMIAVVVRNLISNAIKYTGRGKKIKVGAIETPDKIAFTVADEGVGMTPECLEKIRNRENIVSRHGTENEKGYGMGLKIVSDFVSKMGATIDFASESGMGTQITVSMNTGTELEMPTEQIKEEETTTQEDVLESIDKSFFEDKTVLVVDDDTLLLDNIKAMLSSFVTVQTAGNGEEGMELAEKTIPDLIISDIDMPKMNGIDMCKNLALKSTTSNIPVLFLSAKQEMSTKIAGLSAGAIDYIVKPFNEGELLLKTSNFLRMQQLRQIKILAGSLNDSNDNIVDEEINPLIQQLLDCIKENYVNPDYSFNDIAKDLGFSKSTLTRRLKSIIDKSPVEILSEYRLHKAKSLLAEGKLSVSEIAYAVGFNDPSYFSRKYKDYFGTSPSK
ncbi:MAG: response regulator, partial [Paludibacteraceae bacterium]|nr:response regulator [Paludibacteraceae bacterium]